MSTASPRFLVIHSLEERSISSLSLATFNTSVLPKQLKVAFLRVSIDPYITNPLRCYACQVFGHHENKCHREEICANCGQPKHSSDETDCKRSAKCFNCKEDHPADSKQCQAWHTENETLKVNYTRNISFPDSSVGCFGLNGPLRQHFSLNRAVSQREGQRKEK